MKKSRSALEYKENTAVPGRLFSEKQSKNKKRIDSRETVCYFSSDIYETFEAKIKPEGAPTESGGSWKPVEGSPANGSLRERGTEAKLLSIRTVCSR